MVKPLLLLSLLSVQAFAVQIAPFRADVTPPVGAPLCGGLVKPAVGVSEPLLALGVVLLSDEKPVVLCAIDFCEIRGADHIHWREVLATAAGTSAERVALHSLHQHNAPLVDNAAQKLLPEIGILDAAATEKALAGIAASIGAALKAPQPVTHISTGEAKVLEVAGNRRVQVIDGKVGKMRGSGSKDPVLRALPEGLIDPFLKTVSFWNGDKKLAALHYYATHPMSYYGDGIISHDFAGMAREKRTQEEGVPHIYFTGCGGNIGAGKYNDGAPANRTVLRDRMADAMRRAKAAEKPVSLDAVRWVSESVAMPLRTGKGFGEEEIVAAIADAKLDVKQRANHARYLAFLRMTKGGRKIDLTALRLGSFSVLHMPGELFVEYQLAAADMRKGELVATAAYGDYGPMYIGTARAYDEGGYETSAVSRVGPAVEDVLMGAMRKVLG